MDDVVVRDGGLFAQRPIKMGAIIVVAPLHAKHTDNQCESTEASERTGVCFGRPESPLQLCPIAFASAMKYSADTDSTNAVYQFGGWNKVNQAARKLSAEQVMAEHATGMSMDIVATKDIAVGDEIILGLADGKLVEYGIEMSDYKFPRTWWEESLEETPKIEDESESGTKLS